MQAKADDGIEQLHLQAASAHDITIQWTTTTVSEPSVAFRCSARDSAWDTIFGQSDSYSVLRAACVTAKGARAVAAVLTVDPQELDGGAQ